MSIGPDSATGEQRLQLQAADGASAEVHLHGAHVTRWTPAGGKEALFLSDRSEFRDGAAIRGGVPVIFPQFASEGPLPKHGFARTRRWTLVEQRADAVRLRLQASSETLALWPHPFSLELQIAVGGDSLQLGLTVLNDGPQPFAFTAALHTYLLVSDIGSVSILGLQGLRYRDSAAQKDGLDAQQKLLRIQGEVDRIYFDAPPELELYGDRPLLHIAQSGFADTVIWNPGPEKGAALKDMEPDAWRRMLCVEAAAIGKPLQLAPGCSWSGSQTLRALAGA